MSYRGAPCSVPVQPLVHLLLNQPPRHQLFALHRSELRTTHRFDCPLSHTTVSLLVAGYPILHTYMHATQGVNTELFISPYPHPRLDQQCKYDLDQSVPVLSRHDVLTSISASSSISSSEALRMRQAKSSSFSSSLSSPSILALQTTVRQHRYDITVVADLLIQSPFQHDILCYAQSCSSVANWRSSAKK